MFGIPLHPALVHIPVGAAVVAPLLAVTCFLLIRGGWLHRRGWIAMALVQLVVFGSGLAAFKAGEQEEDRVERVVRKELIHEHEEKAEAFLWTSGVTLVVAVGGMVAPGAGLAVALRGATVLGTVITLASASLTGHSGGELVYKHGAARAHQSQQQDPLMPAEQAPQ